MPKRPFATRVADVAAESTPVSAIGAELVRTYAGRISAHGSGGSLNHEIELLRVLCAMVHAKPLPVLSVAALESLLQLPAASAHQQRLRRKVIRRVVRILQDDGLVPSSHDLRYDRKLHELLDGSASYARDHLKRWFARRHSVGAYELYHEARRLELLEEVLAAHPAVEEGAAIGAWLGLLVRPVVDCGCPQVTRAKDGLVCSSCGATALPGIGTRPSPGLRKQAELRSLAAKYLAQRRPYATATRYA